MGLSDIPAWRMGLLLVGGLIVMAVAYVVTLVRRGFGRRKDYYDLPQDQKDAYKIATTIDRPERFSDF